MTAAYSYSKVAGKVAFRRVIASALLNPHSLFSAPLPQPERGGR